ncbi:hypothetical protein [Enterococcus sp. BWR-S5]|uniref:hypothetical protein n=1 Tax=Enterococcus sp. BWR-S5 TaxID=2787714 RepID=UPI0019214CEE|nr:hypothetical protein [Enterococcus sp. BWR-S5]MBL1223992.1 hypothetical protein [Enterococcus sp. BWR-S5]
MKVVRIEYPTTLDKIEDTTNDNIDVFVTLDDDFTYVIEVATIKNIAELMEDGFLGSRCPFIIVDELREEIIWKAMEEHAQEDAFWLKMNAMAHTFTTDELQIKIDEVKEYHKELDELERVAFEERALIIAEALAGIETLESGELFTLETVTPSINWNELYESQRILANKTIVRRITEDVYKDFEVVRYLSEFIPEYRKK